jgi:hypothetical protein
MKKTLTLAMGLAGALSLSACQTPQQQTGTLAGGAIGAGGGALIGSALTHGSAGGRLAWRRDWRFNRQCCDGAAAAERPMRAVWLRL